MVAEIISAFCAFAFDCAIAAAAGPLERNRPNSLSQSDDQSRGLHNAGGRTISCSLSTYLIGRRCCIAGRLQVVLLNAAFVGFYDEPAIQEPVALRLHSTPKTRVLRNSIQCCGAVLVMPHCGRLCLWLAGYRGRKEEMYHLLSSFVSAVSQLWKATAYHPERHYMRGPGPKWREKH